MMRQSRPLFKDQRYSTFQKSLRNFPVKQGVEEGYFWVGKDPQNENFNFFEALPEFK